MGQEPGVRTRAGTTGSSRRAAGFEPRPALGKQSRWSRDYPIDVPATPTLPDALPRSSRLAQMNKRRMQLASFVRAVLMELSWNRELLLVQSCGKFIRVVTR